MKYVITYRNGSKLTIKAHWIAEDEEGFTVSGIAACGIAEMYRLSRKYIEKIVEVPRLYYRSPAWVSNKCVSDVKEE